MMNDLHGVVMSTTGTTADAFSDPIDMRDANGLALEINHVGTLTGPIYLQGSNSYKIADQTAEWFILKDSAGTDITLATLAGAGLTAMVNVSDVRCAFVRAFYDDTSGTGALKVFACVKGKG